MISQNGNKFSREQRPMIVRTSMVGWVLICLIPLTSCNEGSPVEPSLEQIVIRAYLYAGESVSDIQLTRTILLSSTDSIAPPVNDANVTLRKSGQAYQLMQSPGDSGYYHYPGNDLQVRAGDRFDIEVLFQGRTSTAWTVVPPPPDGVTISSDKLVIPSTADFSFFQRDSSRLVVQWSNLNSALYYVVIENIEANPEPVTLGSAILNRVRGRFISSPISGNRFNVNILSITHYGRHRVNVYRINQEYADLYRSRQQNSRDLNEPLTNIQNGLGVFSAFNSTAVYFTVTGQ